MNLDEMNKSEALEYVNNANTGFIKSNNIKLIDYDKESAAMEVNITENSLNPYGIVHGGLIFTLADTSMGIIARATGKIAVTLNSQINQLLPAKGPKLISKAKAIKIGRNTALLTTEIFDDQNNLIASSNATYYFLNEKSRL